MLIVVRMTGTNLNISVVYRNVTCQRFYSSSWTPVLALQFLQRLKSMWPPSLGESFLSSGFTYSVMVQYPFVHELT